MNIVKSVFILLFITHFSFAQENNSIKDSINAKLVLAMEKKELSKFDEAIDLYNDVIQLGASNNLEISEANAYTEIANIYYHTNKIEEALEMLIRASQIQRRLNDTKGIASSYNTYGMIYTSTGEFEKALDYFSIAENNFETLGLEQAKAKVILNKGLLYYEKKQHDSAYYFIQNAADIFKNGTNDFNIAHGMIESARVLNQLDRHDEAINQVTEAITITENEGFSVLASDSKKVLSEIYERQGDFSQAYTLLKEHLLHKDEIYSQDKERLNQEALARFNAEDKNRMIEKLGQEFDAQERVLKRNRLTSYLALALGAILLLFTISLYRNNKNRYQINKLLQKKNDDLSKANNAKAQFLSTVTHELRTPLYAVTGLTDILLETKPTQEQKKHLKSLKFSGDYLLNFINDILQINKIEANKLELEKRPFNLKKLINSVIIAFKSSEKNNGNTIHFDFGQRVPEMLLGDSVKLSQILFNLIGNALKFTENGNIWIRVINLNAASPNEVQLRFEIEDTGIGISEEKLDAIFESFSQGSIQINRKYGGTGLGLTIVKNLLELLGSKIHLKSKEGKGTMFYFDLTYETTDLKEETDHTSLETEDHLKVLKGKKILIVEDIKVNQLITQKILDRKEIISSIVDNGSDAVANVQTKHYDLILMDIHMPGISGIEATKLIRGFNPSIPIIALTAVTIDDKMDDFYEAGFDDILSKPFKPNELFDKIHHLIVKKPLK